MNTCKLWTRFLLSLYLWGNETKVCKPILPLHFKDRMSKSAPYHSLGSPILTQIFKKRFREKEAKSFFFQQKKAENLNVSLPLHSICILHSLPHPTSVIFIQIKIFWVSIIPLLHDTRQHRVLLSSAPVRCYNKHDKQ